MRKRVVGRKLSRGQGSRRALFRGLTRALVAHGAIVTTKTKAKTIQKQIDKIINLAKRDGIAEKRRVYAILGNDRETSQSLFQQVAPNFKDRVGGYTRIVNLPKRRGDSAEMARLEWVKHIGVSDKRQVTSNKEKSKSKKKNGKVEDNAIKKKGRRLIEKVKKRK